MNVESIERDFHEKVSGKIRLYREGTERYRVFTPFLFEDGDHLAVVLKKNNKKWVLSDEAHTFMHLTYDIDEKDLGIVIKNPRYNMRLSIDRKDNSLGYEKGNLALACMICNKIKSDFFSEKEMLEIAKKYVTPRVLKAISRLKQ